VHSLLLFEPNIRGSSMVVYFLARVFYGFEASHHPVPASHVAEAVQNKPISLETYKALSLSCLSSRLRYFVCSFCTSSATGEPSSNACHPNHVRHGCVALQCGVPSAYEEFHRASGEVSCFTNAWPSMCSDYNRAPLEYFSALILRLSLSITHHNYNLRSQY